MDCSQKRVGGIPLCALMFGLLAMMLVPTTDTITVSEKQAIKKGLQTGKEIFGFIKAHKFHETLSLVSKSIGSFLGILGPFIGLVMAFVPSADSAELTFMKDMMKEIDRRFDQVDSRFDEVERLVDWTDVAVNFGQIQQKINAMDAEYRLFYASSAPDQNRKYLYKMHFENTYQLSGTILYQALVIKQGTFNEDLGEAIMRYTKNDRKKTQDFLLGILEILLQAVRIELAYYEMSGFATIRKERNEEWERRIENVRLKLQNTDTIVMNKYIEQSKEETLEYARDNSKVKHDDFSAGLYNRLVQKYYWRDWFVLISDTTSYPYYYQVKVCGGYILTKQNGRNIVTASKDKTALKMDINKARFILEEFKVENDKTTDPLNFPAIALVDYWEEQQEELYPIDSVFHRGVKLVYDARQIFERADKSDSCCFAVVDYSINVSYKSGEGRVVFRDLNPYFKLFMFG